MMEMSAEPTIEQGISLVERHPALGTARVSRAGERVLAIANFVLLSQFPTPALRMDKKFVPARRRNQHARRMR
jgi:hypothetical protein